MRNPDGGVPCTVYVLKSTGEDQPRYIGQTSDDINHRLGGHMVAAKSGSTTPVCQWIREQQADGFKIEIIPMVTERTAVWNDTEKRMIKAFREMGIDIKNVQDGGGSTEGYVMQYQFTPEHRAKISAVHKGRICSAETRAKISQKVRLRNARKLMERYY